MKYLKTSELIQPAGKRALAALLTAAMTTSGVAVVASPISQAVPAPASGENAFGKKPRGASGQGTLTIDNKVKPGGVITIKGSEMPERGEGGFVNFMLNDGTGELKWPEQGDGVNVGESDDSGRTVPFAVANWTDKSSFIAAARLPENIQPGFYWIRMQAGNDNAGPAASRIEWFEVVATAPELSATKPSYKSVSISGANFAANSELSVTVNGKPAKFIPKKHTTADTVTADAEGKTPENLQVKLDANVVPAGTLGVVSVRDKEGNSAVATFTGVPNIELAGDGRDGAGSGRSAGNNTNVTVTNLKNGTKVTYFGSKDKNWLGADKAVTAADNKAELSKVLIPADTPVGTPIIMKYNVAGKEFTQEVGATVSTNEKLENEAAFTVKKAELAQGLYQSAYYEKENVLFVTSSAGKRPIGSTELLKVDADTLKVKNRVTPPTAADEKQGPWGVFGVAVDEKNDRVWVTNTRHGSVAVYDAKTMKLIKQFDKGVMNHPRGVVVLDDGTAVISDSGDTKLGLFKADGSSEFKDLSAVPDASDMVLDRKTGKIYTASWSKPVAAVIDTKKDFEVTTIPLGATASRITAVAFNADKDEIYVANQGGDSVLVASVKDKKQINEIPVGAKPVGIAYDPVNKVVMVTSRDAGTATAIDAKTLKKTGVIGLGRNANHIMADGKGNFFTVNKRSQGFETEKPDFKDQIFKITPKSGKPGAGGSLPGSSSDNGSGGSSIGSSNTGRGSSSNPALQAIAGLAVGGLLLAGIAALFKTAVDMRLIDVRILPKPVRDMIRNFGK